MNACAFLVCTRKEAIETKYLYMAQKIEDKIYLFFLTVILNYQNKQKMFTFHCFASVMRFAARMLGYAYTL